MQSSSVEWAADHHALHFATIDNFPRFADALLRRKLFVKFGFEPPAAPYSLKENWLEGEGSSEFVPWHFAQTSNVQSAFANAAAWQASNSRFEVRANLFLRLDAQCSLSDVRRSVLTSHFRRLSSG